MKHVRISSPVWNRVFSLDPLVDMTGSAGLRIAISLHPIRSFGVIPVPVDDRWYSLNHETHLAV
jgi:hypothetical protein